MHYAVVLAYVKHVTIHQKINCKIFHKNKSNRRMPFKNFDNISVNVFRKLEFCEIGSARVIKIEC